MLISKKIKIVAAILLLIPFAAAAQDDPMHELLTEYQTAACPEYIHNAEFLIPRLHAETKFDSIATILDYVEQRCGQGHFADYNILRSIETAQFPDDWCDSCTVDEMLRGHFGWDDFMICGFGSQFLNFTPYQQFIKELAESLYESTDSLSLAHMVCRHYADDHAYVMSHLRRGDLAGSCLQREYDQRIREVEEEFKSFRVHGGLNLGIWMPFDSAEVLGNKLEFGCEGGLRFNRLGFDITALVRLLESKEFYELYYNERLVPTDKFVGGYIGGSFVGELFRLKRYNLELFAGGGYDGFTALTGDEHKSVNSYNVNFGFTARYFFNKQVNQFFGVQFRYSIPHYCTHGGTDLSGNTISLNLVYGYLGNSFATSRAEDLWYYE